MESPKKLFYTPHEIRTLFRERGLPENFCVVPFSNLIFNPGGKISVCRQKGTDHSIGDLKTSTVEELWNSPYMQEWRQEFLSGKVQICKFEQETSACHLSSSNYHYFEQAKFEVLQEQNILKFTANFNGHCNIQCKMCHVWQMENGFYDKINFWAEAKQKFFPHIREIELLSGEPFIQKDTYRLINEVSALNPQCEWSFTTNGFWKFNDFIKEHLNKIRIKNIIISIDSLDVDRYASIRKNGHLPTVLRTVQSLLEYNKERLAQGKSDLGLTLHYLAMRDNFFDVFAILDFCERNQIRHTLRALEEPKEQSLLSYSEEKKISELTRFFSMGKPEHLRKSSRISLAIIKTLQPINQAAMLILLQKLFKEKPSKDLLLPAESLVAELN